jgi:NAD(P)-dependent dehydrogenase (short-subunit alcohol dehydrogenase family)
MKPSGKLAGEAALVTGAGRGIGRAIAQALHDEGALLAAADIDSESAHRTAGDLSPGCLPLVMDVSSKDSVDDGIRDAIAHFGHLDILVNNAGCLNYTTWEDCTEEEWDRVVDTNLKGTFLCCQAVLAHMKERRHGTIINMSSISAKTGGVTVGPHYAGSKAGISAITLGLAAHLAPHGVRVNGIAPGVIDTPMTDDPELQGYADRIPLGGAKGRPEDIANCALFLASEDARHITGEIIDVNGGLFMD